jgi:hypothetical protein
MDASVDDRTARGRECADRVLRRIFGSIKPGLRYRLWDGTESAIGKPDGSFTLVIRDRETFRQAFSTSNTRLLAEAFVDNRIEVEGDLFAAMRVANALEDIELSLTDKLGILLDCRRV